MMNEITMLVTIYSTNVVEYKCVLYTFMWVHTPFLILILKVQFVDFQMLYLMFY